LHSSEARLGYVEDDSFRWTSFVLQITYLVITIRDEKPQLLQRDRAMIRDVEYFSK